MTDLIERGEVFKALWARNKHEGADLDALITMEDALSAVVSIPTVDAVDGDLISRAALLDDIDKEREILVGDGRLGAEHIVVHHARRLIEDAPAVDAIPVKWIKQKTAQMRQPCEAYEARIIETLIKWWEADKNG